MNNNNNMHRGYIDDLLTFLVWLWRSVLYPFVVLAIAQLVFDGMEAWHSLPESLYVMLCFFTGRSHRPFPVYVKKKRSAPRPTAPISSPSGAAPGTFSNRSDALLTSSPTATRASAGMPTSTLAASMPRNRGQTQEMENRSQALVSDRDPKKPHDTSDDSTSEITSPVSGESSPSSPSSTSRLGSGGAATVPSSPSHLMRFFGFLRGWKRHLYRPVEGTVYITRRRYFRGTGDFVELPRIRASFLVPPAFPLTNSESLHRLVGNIIGPIQQPTVSTLPTRHTEPQWPPHVPARPSLSKHHSHARDRGKNTGGTTDDNSSESASNSSMRYSTSHFRLESTSVETMRAEFHGMSASPAVGNATNGRTPQSNAERHGYRSSDGSEVVGTGVGGYMGNRGFGPSQQSPALGVSSVVYRRVSSKAVDFDAHFGRTSSFQPIPSITAHHVLSYQATRQKVLVMDLDETLCHVSTTTANMSKPPTYTEVIPTISGAELVYVWERPHVQLFLNTLSKLFNLVVFTSSSKPYADSILRRVDPNQHIKRRFYRHDCKAVQRSTLTHHAVSNDSMSQPPTPQQRDGELSAKTSFTQSVRSADGRPISVSAKQLPGRPVSSSLGENSDTILMKDLRVLQVPPELIVMIDNDEERVQLNRSNVLVIPSYVPRGDERNDGDDAERGTGGRSAAGSATSATKSRVNAWPWPSAPWLSKTKGNVVEDDEVLLALIPFLEALLVVPDTRSVLRHGTS